jgi:hypothetical protein
MQQIEPVNCKDCVYEHTAANVPPCDCCVGDRFVAKSNKEVSDGSSADYYKLPKGATQLQDLIGDRNMNAQIGEIFRACYRYGRVSHSPEIRDIKKIIYYANAELDRLIKLETK